MDIIRTKADFEDDRGEIRDILLEDTDAVAYITFKAGAVRGNHFHDRTDQWDYILSGSYECYARKGFGAEIEKEIVKKGDRIHHPKGSHHAYRALEDAEMLSFTKGPRRGPDYESDVVRLADGEKLV
jgi:quercetin dioxygenase-like cupin family protein